MAHQALSLQVIRSEESDEAFLLAEVKTVGFSGKASCRLPCSQILDFAGDLAIEGECGVLDAGGHVGLVEIRIERHEVGGLYSVRSSVRMLDNRVEARFSAEMLDVVLFARDLIRVTSDRLPDVVELFARDAPAA